MYIGPTIIAGFGFNVEQSTLLNMGSGAATVVGTFLAMFIARYTSRTIAGIYTLILSCIGVSMMLAIPSSNYGARYGGYILTLQCKLRFYYRKIYRDGGITNTVIFYSPYLRPLYYNLLNCWCWRVYKEVCFHSCLSTWICSG